MPFAALLRLARPYRNELIVLGLLAIATSLATLLVPWFAGQMIGDIVAPQSSGTVRLAVILLLALAALALLNYASVRISGTTANRLLADLRIRIHDHLQSLPVGFHESRQQGDTLALMTFEVVRLSLFLTGTLVSIPAQLLTVVGAVFVMLRIDPKLALLVPLLVPSFYLILRIVGRRLRGLGQAIRGAEAQVVAIAGENLQMLPAIKAFAREGLESARYAAQVHEAMELSIQERRIYATLEPLIALIAGAGAVVLLVLAGQGLQAGRLSPAELFSFLFYAALLTRPVGTLAQVYGQVQTARGTLARLQSVLDEPVEPGLLASGHVERATGAISFERIGFAYPDRDATLQDASAVIRAGEVVAFTGANGTGKTTLVNLLLRFYDPQHGRILLDGHDIASIAVQDLRRQIGHVPQRALLFNATIRANIAYGHAEAGDAEIEAAARLAQAHDFIVALPQGYETRIGDHGLRLSGGQRQRIALARALVKNPPVLVLDEATSMYDLEGENAFIAACATALQGRTVILITHRPASMALANRIFAIEDRAIVELP